MDERKLLEMIDCAYAAALDPEGWQTFVDRLSAAYGGVAALYTQDTRTLAGEISVFAGTDPLYAKQFEDHYCFKNVWYRSNRPIGSLMTGHVSESRSLERSEYYSDWLRPQRLSANIVTPVAIQGSAVTNVVILRSQKQTVFASGELDNWKRLIPHMLRAVQVHQKVQASQLKRDSALHALDQLHVGVILASTEGRLLLANPAAEQILSSGSGLTALSGRLHAETPAATCRLRRLIFEAAQTGDGKGSNAGGTLALPVRDGPPLAVMISPVPANSRTLSSTPMAMLLLTKPGHGAQVDMRAVEHRYDLTPAQAQLVQALIDGRRLSDYADGAGLSINTVKSHMKQIFEKTGENRQADLVRRVLADPLLKQRA